MSFCLSTILERRAIIDERVRSLADKVPLVFPTEEISIGGVPCMRGTVVGSELTPKRCIVYVHGGCFVFGSARIFMPIVMEYCQDTGASVIAPDYSLAPERPFPHARDQIVAVYEQLLLDGFSPHSIAFIGDSAGANLIMSALLVLRDVGTALPAAVALISPWLDLTLSGDTADTLSAADPELSVSNLRLYANAYCLSADPSNPYISPAFATLAALPPLLIQVGTRELLLSDAVRLAESYRAADRVVFLEIYEGMSHVFHMDRTIPTTRVASKYLTLFLKKYHSRVAPTFSADDPENTRT